MEGHITFGDYIKFANLHFAKLTLKNLQIKPPTPPFNQKSKKGSVPKEWVVGFGQVHHW